MSLLRVKQSLDILESAQGSVKTELPRSNLDEWVHQQLHLLQWL